MPTAIFAPNLTTLPRIICTVTNDLSYDQRMQRICTSLSSAGYEVVLVGRRLKTSISLQGQPFTQKRLPCFFTKGFLFYTEYNLRLLFFLLFTNANAFCAIDLDTILPNYIASVIRRKPRVYDAHELFTELIEVVSRPQVHKVWLAVERFLVPRFQHGYTVNLFIKEEFKRRYQVDYQIVRNLPLKKDIAISEKYPRFTVLYQGAVNEGRSFETLIPAMQYVNANLLICGNGNYFTQVQGLIQQYGVEDKVKLMGAVLPNELKAITPKCHVGVTIFESEGLNQYYSLANRFFDYMMAGIPQICVNYPEYAHINNQYGFAYMIKDLAPQTIATALNNLQIDNVLYKEIEANCAIANAQLNWQEEEKTLIQFWKTIL
jgi:glycosyltransferase involved in cell wall biosynthesis